MRRLIAIVALFALALPATAQETQVVDISHELVTTEDGTRPAHKVEGRSGNTEDIKTSIVGEFLWVTYGDVEDTYDALSVDISDTSIIRAVVSLDGTVELVRSAPKPAASEPVVQPEVEVIDLTVKYPSLPVE